MQVKLKVLSGSHAGKEIKLSSAKFFIGRGEDCHLRPQSDLISRHHCALIVENGAVIVRDLKSRNGTMVNGEKIAADVHLKAGDKLKVGPLEFEVLIDHAATGVKKPKVASVKEAAERVAEEAATVKPCETIDTDVSSWLEEADEEERQQRMHSPETRQFRIDSLDYQKHGDETGVAPALDTTKQASAAGDTGKADAKKKTEKKQPGKLPKISAESSTSSRDAAAEMLKKFFNRR
jgi:pSer/pThr/pTyr-binding forkhead associated (FHA) protein